jgi:3',5'-cyclic AMP phosphodiesterase CpdA
MLSKNIFLAVILTSLAANSVFAAETCPHAGCECEEARVEKTEPYFYIVAADPQLLWKQKDNSLWRKTISHVNRLQPDFMIVCGDLIQADNSATAWENTETVKKYDELARQYLSAVEEDLKPEISLYNVAGNHDVSLQPTEKSLKWYEQKFGKAWYSFEHKNSLFVVLESNLLRDGEGAPAAADRQLDWLKQTLKESKNKSFDHKTAYMHHPLCIHSVDEKDQYFNVPQPRRAELLKMFHDHGFRAVFCGHYHQNAYVKDGDLELITTSSCCVPLGKDKKGFRVVKVYGDRIEHEYFEFENLPEKIVLEAD